MGKYYNSKHTCLTGLQPGYRHHAGARAYRPKSKEGDLKTLKVKPAEKRMALFALAGLVVATYLAIQGVIHFGQKEIA